MDFKKNSIGIFVLLASFSFFSSGSWAAPKAKPPAALAEVVDNFSPDSIEGQALQRAKDLPNPSVQLPPANMKSDAWEEKIKYARAICPAYVKQYEELYLKQFHITKEFSPFLGYCEKRSARMERDPSLRPLDSAALLKRMLDRVSVTFEVSGGLVAAQDKLAKASLVENLNHETGDLEKDINELRGQIKAMSDKQAQLEAQLRNERNSSGGLLGMAGLSKTSEVWIVEGALIVALGLIGFLVFSNSRY